MSRLDVRRELRSLKKRFDAALASYEQLRESNEGSVVRWVWATAPRYELDPLFFLDWQAGDVGRIAEGPPSDARGSVAYGFSAENRIVAEREYLTDLHDRYYSTFYLEAKDRVISYHFHHEPAQGCINCSQLIFSGSYPICYQKWAIRGWSSDTYITMDGRMRSFNRVFKQDDERQQRLSGELRYGEDEVIEVWTKWPGTRKPELTFRGTLPAENPFLRVELRRQKCPK